MKLQAAVLAYTLLLFALHLPFMSYPIEASPPIIPDAPLRTDSPAQTTDTTTVLFNDTFDRPDNATVGDYWHEVEPSANNITITGNALHFAPQADGSNDMLINRLFPRVTTGSLTWHFDFNWSRPETTISGPETYRLFMPLVADTTPDTAASVPVSQAKDYYVLMQLGDSSEMQTANWNDGVGINLVWTELDDTHATLGYYREDSIKRLNQVNAPARLTVVADLDRQTYAISVDGVQVAAQVPFDGTTALDSVRFVTNASDTARLEGRTFDNLDLRWNTSSDAQAPAVSLLAPHMGQTIQAPATVPLTATAVDPDGTVSQVAFYADNVPIGVDSVQPYSLDWTVINAGEYALTAVATDDNGQTATSAPIPVRVNPSSSPKNLGTLGTYAQWSRVEMAMTGPPSEGMSEDRNPFKIIVDVAFTGPAGNTVTVPAFYDGDGSGNLDGNVWKARFAPDQIGTWRFVTQSDTAELDGYHGNFTVVEPDGCSARLPGALPNFGCTGRLSYVNERYLGFADGSFFLKGGIDEPEDFLAPGGAAGFASKEAAIDYLAEHGINSIYVMLHNIDGDRKNVWPWVGPDQATAKDNHEHFDVARLAEWEQIFRYIQSKGLVLHIVLEDDSAWTGFNRDMYYREMVARFAHHNGIYWNIGEEHDEQYTFTESQDFAQALRDLDPYDHPITVHNINEPEPDLISDPNFSLTSIQTGQFQPQNDLAIDWYEAALRAGRPFPIFFDEVRNKQKNDLGPTAENRRMARHIVWSIYLGGAGFELFVDPPGAMAYRDYVDFLDDISRARGLLEELPYWSMRPANELLSGDSAYLLADPGNAYVVYLPPGEQTVQLDLSDAASTTSFNIERFNPRTGARQSAGTIAGNSITTLSTPDSEDWVFKLIPVTSDE